MRFTDVNQAIILSACKNLRLPVSLDLYHFEMLPIFFYLSASFFFAPYPTLTLTSHHHPPSVPDVNVNLAPLPCQESGSSIECSRDPSEILEQSKFWKIINAFEKMLFFSEAVGAKQCQRSTKWCGSCHAKQTTGWCFSSELSRRYISKMFTVLCA